MARTTEKTKQLLYPGDTVEYSVTIEHKQRGGSHWVKCGASTTIQAGETESDARVRVESYVDDAIVENVKAWAE